MLKNTILFIYFGNWLFYIYITFIKKKTKQDVKEFLIQHVVNNENRNKTVEIH